MKLAYRGAAVLILLFCAGHTVGSIAGRSPGGAADAVLVAMRDVHFDFKGSDRTFYEIFFGYELLVTFYLAGSALLALWLARADEERWRFVAPIAWGLAAAQLATAAVVWACFFIGPAVLTSLATILLVVGAVRGSQGAARSRSAEARA
jgi:hypothetical protein